MDHQNNDQNGPLEGKKRRPDHSSSSSSSSRSIDTKKVASSASASVRPSDQDDDDAVYNRHTGRKSPDSSEKKPLGFLATYVFTRQGWFVFMFVLHLLIASSTAGYIRSRTQDASTDVHVLCGTKEDPFSLDTRTPEITKLLSSNPDLMKEMCDLEFTQPIPTVAPDSRHSHEHGTPLGAYAAPQFDKFIMFFTDCWPHHYADQIFTHYQAHAQIFLVDIPGAKYSHAIYTAYMTGQPPTNYEGKPMTGDHLVRSLKRSYVRQKESEADTKSSQRDLDRVARSQELLRVTNADRLLPEDASVAYPLRYIGPEWSFLAIFGIDNYHRFFNADVEVYKEALDQPFRHPYPFFFENPNANQFWTDYRAGLLATGQSMMAHTGVMDHRQHGEHRGLGAEGKAFPRTDEMAVQLQKDMMTLRDWVDEHPEYLLVLASDHGVDEFDFSGYKMHGESANGNEPYVLFYSPRLAPQGAKWIDVVDVAPTLSMYLKGVDIPLNALGMPHTFFGDSPEGRKSQVGAYKQSLVQLNKAARRRGVHVDTATLESLLIEKFVDDSGPSNETQLARLRSFIVQLKADMYTGISLPLGELVAYTVMVAAVVLSLLLGYNDQLEVYVISRDFFGFAFEMMKALVMYALCLLQMMFCSWTWSVPADGGFAFRILAPSLALLIFRNVHTHTHAEAGSGIVAAAESLIFQNEMLNALLLFVKSCLPSLLSWIDGDAVPVTRFVAAIVGWLAISRHFAVFHANGSEAGFRRALQAMLGLVLVYSLSPRTSSMFVGGFHIAALPVYVMCLFVFPVKFFARRQFPDVITSLAMVMHLVSCDNPSRQIVVWMVVVQFNCLIVPMCESLRLLLCVRKLRQHLEYKFSTTAQAMNIYMLNQAFFTFFFGFGDKINFDVHPFSGAIGMKAYDTLKPFSAFLMAFHKYGIFVLLILMMAQLGQLHLTPDPRLVVRWASGLSDSSISTGPDRSFKDRLGSVSVLRHRSVARWIGLHMSMTACLFTACTGLGFYLMFAIAAKQHAFEQATCTLFLGSFIGAGYALMTTYTDQMDARKKWGQRYFGAVAS